ncbi:MAG: regulatory protein RecX [Gammaproteobacteria bacterium]
MKASADTTAASPRNKAMDLLARREHSAAELRAKLVARRFDRDDVDRAVEQLIDEGLVSDVRFAEAFVAARIRKGQGPVRIRGELARRGLAPELIEAQLDRVDIDWYDMARSVRSRKFGPEQPTQIRERARQSRFLQQRGFTGEQIARAFENDRQAD